MASIPFTSFTPPIKSPPNACKSNMFHSTLNSNFLSTIFRPKSCFVTKISKSSNGSSLAAFACATTSPFIGKVGLQNREGNVSLLSFGTSPSHMSEVAVKTDSSQILSATLPFVVALTGIAALSQPSTFTWAQLSSYASFLSKGVVALSILLTSLTTIASVLVNPLLTGLLVGSVVPVNAVAMSKSILQVVLVPLTFGLVLNTYAKPVMNILRPIMPFVAMICTSMCIGSPLAINRSQILSAEGLRLVGPVLTFPAVALLLGTGFLKFHF